MGCIPAYCPSLRQTWLAACILLFIAPLTALAQQHASEVTGGNTGTALSDSASGDAVQFQSRDSLVYRAGTEKEAVLYGSANVTHTENRLTAGKISLFLNRDEVHAESDNPADSLAYPQLTQGSRELRSSRILFNYETGRGKFDAAEVDAGEGFIRGDKVKNVSREEVFVEQGRYSTCPPTHMYYYIEADRMKVVEEEEVFFTNARLFLLDIPYPILFPFGYVPSGIDQRRQSGFLEPTYAFQDNQNRGLGLQNLGWFQYFNDYLTGQTSFDIFTSGTFFNETRLQYRRTGNYSGSITLGYSSERGMESTDPDFTEIINRRIGIQHSQDISPYASLNANIDLRTQDYYQRTSYDIDERAQTSSSSSLTYRYRHPGNLYTLNVSNRLNQQFSDNSARFSGPRATFSLRQLTPFERDIPTGQQRWYETISIRYNNEFQSNFSYNPELGAEEPTGWFEALLSPSKYREVTGDDRHLDLGFRQQVRLSANNLIPSQFLNTSGNFSLTEFWYPTTTRQEWDEAQQEIVTIQKNGFATGREFNTGINFSTTVYGVSQAQIGKLEGFRHTLRPTVGFSYRPDFSDEMWGYYRDVQVDSTGRTRRYSIFEEEVYGGPGQGEQMNLNFAISNVFETKHVRRDSTGEVQSTNLRLIDNLSASSSYNFAADSLNFSNINVSLSTRLLEGVNLSMSANYSLYSRNADGREIDRYIWQDTGKILQPLSYSLSANYSIEGGPGGGARRINTPIYGPYDPLDQQLFGPVDTRFNMQPISSYYSPWSASFSFSYRWNYVFQQAARQSATLNVNNIRFNLTPKWSVSTRFGFDFIDQELTPSQFQLNRRMVCWTMSFQFNPFGDFQYYFFRLSIDSGQIQSLFQKLPLLNNLERSSSPSGRSPRF